METSTPALDDRRLRDVEFKVVRHGRVGSLEEAAKLRGVSRAAVIKTLVVRRDNNDYLLVLVPGNRSISWPKLRKHLGVRRLSMPSPQEAQDATGYVRGTITPFGATHDWPIIADQRIEGADISIGGGAPGVSITINGDRAITILNAEVADVTVPLKRDEEPL
jgi:Cys-tRNA(Pro)/Cys-tRNA(Cys) deacylase